MSDVSADSQDKTSARRESRERMGGKETQCETASNPHACQDRVESRKRSVKGGWLDRDHCPVRID